MPAHFAIFAQVIFTCVNIPFSGSQTVEEFFHIDVPEVKQSI